MVDFVNYYYIFKSMKQKHINEIRAFNRFYTIIIGLLDRHILDSQFTLPEARVLFELNRNNNITASEIITSLHMDKGYLSRMLKQFEKKKMIFKVRSESDRRITHIRLTQSGKEQFEKLDKASNDQIAGLLKQLSSKECELLIKNMNSIESILNKVEVSQ